jgi:glutathione peroxidase
MIKMSTSIYDFSAKLLSGKTKKLSDFKGKALIVVNTASKCGLTPQYEGLEKLYGTYKDQGLEILGFPCNQFGAQEPGAASDIQEFCSINYGVSFTMFDKVDVNGDSADPLFKWLKKEALGLLGSEAIKWNFTKFLVGKDGQVIERIASTTEPASMTKAIEAALA